MHLYWRARAQRQHHLPMKVSETPFRKLNGDPLRIFHSVPYRGLPPFHSIAASSHSGVSTRRQPLNVPTSAIHRASPCPMTRQSLPLRTATLRTASVASRTQHHAPHTASRLLSDSTDFTFPRGKGGVRSCTAGGRQHRNSEAVFIRQVAGTHQVKVFSSLHGKARYCRPDDDNGSSRHFLYPSLSRRQTTTFRSQAPEFIVWQLQRCIVQWRGQAIAWLSEIVGCSIAFRRFGLLLQNKYATSLIRTMSLFLGCEEDKSPEVE